MALTSTVIRQGPAWASSLGVVAVVLGVFLSAYHANEWMKQKVLQDAMPAGGQLPAAECPAAELEEEGLTAAECEYMVAHVEGFVLSMPEWFPTVQKRLSAGGAIFAFLSLIVGGMLVNYRPYAPAAAVAVFTALAAVDALQFAAVVNAGPIVRDIYLWNILLWLIIHLMLIAGVIAGHGRWEGAVTESTAMEGGAHAKRLQ